MPVGKSTRCNSCQSENLKDFYAEMAVHSPGLKGLENPIVWMFPKAAVCLNCGLLQAVVAERELRVLKSGEPSDGAVISLSDMVTKRKPDRPC